MLPVKYYFFFSKVTLDLYIIISVPCNLNLLKLIYAAVVVKAVDVARPSNLNFHRRGELPNEMENVSARPRTKNNWQTRVSSKRLMRAAADLQLLLSTQVVTFKKSNYRIAHATLAHLNCSSSISSSISALGFLA
jgi:hypothetical protein